LLRCSPVPRKARYNLPPLGQLRNDTPSGTEIVKDARNPERLTLLPGETLI
jgi:hypothetical protein